MPMAFLPDASGYMFPGQQPPGAARHTPTPLCRLYSKDLLTDHAVALQETLVCFLFLS